MVLPVASMPSRKSRPEAIAEGGDQPGGADWGWRLELCMGWPGS